MALAEMPPERKLLSLLLVANVEIERLPNRRHIDEDGLQFKLNLMFRYYF